MSRAEGLNGRTHRKSAVVFDLDGTLSKTFKITGLSYPVYPQHTDRSAFISQQALPLLRQEILQIKGSSIQLVSGATDTSYGFVQALRGALTKAGA